MSYPHGLSNEQWQVKGRSRHVAIDSQGTLLAVQVCVANKADGAQAGAVMVQACERHPSLESFTADTAYKRQTERVARETLGVELQIVAQPKQPKARRCRIQKAAAASPSGFAGLVERTFAWLGQCRLLSQEYEKTVASAQAWRWGAMMRLLLRRLASLTQQLLKMIRETFCCTNPVLFGVLRS